MRGETASRVRVRNNEKLLAAIRGVLVESGWTYGAPRILRSCVRVGSECKSSRSMMQKRDYRRV